MLILYIRPQMAWLGFLFQKWKHKSTQISCLVSFDLILTPLKLKRCRGNQTQVIASRTFVYNVKSSKAASLYQVGGQNDCEDGQKNKKNLPPTAQLRIHSLLQSESVMLHLKRTHYLRQSEKNDLLMLAQGSQTTAPTVIYDKKLPLEPPPPLAIKRPECVVNVSKFLIFFSQPLKHSHS